MSNLFTDKGKVICPRCNLAQDILAYVRLENLNPQECEQIIKCRNCRYVFAPTASLVQYIVERDN